MNIWYVYVGVVTDPEAHPGAKVGDTEYRFMDDMDNPGMSYDYVSLEKALNELSPCQIVWVPKVRQVMEMNALAGLMYQADEGELNPSLGG